MGSVNFSQFQSAYRKGHSTDTALLEVLGSVYTTASDIKLVTVLIGLDLSAAFDTVNHDILLERLQSKFGELSSALQEYRWPGSSRTSRAGPSLSSWVYISQQSWNHRSAFVGVCSARASVFLPSIAARWVTTSQTMVYITTSTPMTRSSTSP